MTRFDKLMQQRSKDVSAVPEPEAVQAPESMEEAIAPPAATPKRKKRGKRGDPNFTQVTAYIRKETHRQVKLALLQEGSDREFSELVENLLAEYLRTQ